MIQDVYETFNIVMRRKPKENNFKAVLETIRELMNTECVVPEWLHDIVLGYGDPGQAHYTRYLFFLPRSVPVLVKGHFFPIFTTPQVLNKKKP